MKNSGEGNIRKHVTRFNGKAINSFRILIPLITSYVCYLQTRDNEVWPSIDIFNSYFESPVYFAVVNIGSAMFALFEAQELHSHLGYWTAVPSHTFSVDMIKFKGRRDFIVSLVLACFLVINGLISASLLFIFGAHLAIHGFYLLVYFGPKEGVLVNIMKLGAMETYQLHRDMLVEGFIVKKVTCIPVVIFGEILAGFDICCHGLFICVLHDSIDSQFRGILIVFIAYIAVMMDKAPFPVRLESQIADSASGQRPSKLEDCRDENLENGVSMCDPASSPNARDKELEVIVHSTQRQPLSATTTTTHKDDHTPHNDDDNNSTATPSESNTAREDDY